MIGSDVPRFLQLQSVKSSTAWRVREFGDKHRWSLAGVQLAIALAPRRKQLQSA